MSYLVLARKWRPRKFSEVRGQPHAVRALSNAIRAERVHHAWLFAGTRGVGKTTLARILAAALNCEKGAAPEPCGECASCESIQEGRFVDLMEVDAASRTKVEQTRELLENVQYAPTVGRYKIYLIDEAHMLSASSFNALLKTLEEPPPHVKFLLATTEPRRLPVTVLSRCLQINLRSMDSETITDQLTAICKGEDVSAEPGALGRLARAANGSMRDALSLLDQAIAYGADAVRETDVADMLGGADQPSIIHLLNALAAGDGEALLSGAGELRERLADPANILAEMAAALQRLALLQAVGAEILDEDDESEMLVPLADALPADQVQLWYEIAIQGRNTLPLAPDPGLGLEMTLLRMLAFRPESPLNQTARRDQADSPRPPATEGPAPSMRRSAPMGEPKARKLASAPAEPPQVEPVESSAPPAPVESSAPPPKPPEPVESSAPPVPPPAPVERSAPPVPPPEPVESSAPPVPPPEPVESSAPPVPPPEPVEQQELAEQSSRSTRSEPLSPQDWPQTVAKLELDGLCAEIAAHSELAEAADGCIRLRLDGEHENLLTTEARHELRAALLAALPAFSKVEIEIAGAGQGETLAGRNREAERRRQQRAEQEFEADPFVQASLKGFEAKIESGSVRPVDSAEAQSKL